MTAVRAIACVNNAAFVMSFGFEIFDVQIPATVILEGVDSGNYPIDQTRSIDLATTGIAEGTPIRPQVRAVWGDTNLGNRWVTYANNGETATYDVRGTTLNYSVDLIGG
jgi:hypothetical protein